MAERKSAFNLKGRSGYFNYLFDEASGLLGNWSEIGDESIRWRIQKESG